MTLYISKTTLQQAVRRLGVSSSQSSLGDYLIFKRAMAIKLETPEADDPYPDGVVTGLRSGSFIRAIEELAKRRPPGSSEDDDNPYFVPFGAMRDTTRGYRTKKFPSNGPSDTVGRWQSRSSAPPLVLVPGQKPKTYTIRERSAQELRAFFIVKHAQKYFSGHRPHLFDLAVWWFRFANLELRLGSTPSPAMLMDGVTTDLRLSTIEIEALFETSLDDLSFGDDYLNLELSDLEMEEEDELT
ncbi:hypothetical protein OUY22_00610 [Nonomuraea sp. MCN248]|uniref:Uncharacterized protein n=1 Tax=Nonomuraea corallina TaxID=2989783 RepID=A0ABT4S3W8_9ACTN|nr:hypothetical protein [Nonomuraea corallina]MDA0631902.1 hypothetical protein [Nonomuraea corallina]